MTRDHHETKEAQILQLIDLWFGDQPFSVPDLTDRMLDLLLPLMETASDSDTGRRTAAGHGLSAIDGRRFTDTDGRRTMVFAAAGQDKRRRRTYQLRPTRK